MANERIPRKWHVSETLKDLLFLNTLDLKPIQGALKDLTRDNYAKLRDSIYQRGFFIPVFVWFDPNNQWYWLLDGHQRQYVINKEWPKGKMIPCVPIEAENYQDAKLRLLSIDSKFGQVTKDGFDEFVADLDLDSIIEFVNDFTTFDEWLDVEAVEGDQDSDASEKQETPTFGVNITCKDENDRFKVFEKLNAQGYEVKMTGSFLND